ncbi:MAG: hypothetical protein ACM3MG_01805 [Bacillota bacterium]
MAFASESGGHGGGEAKEAKEAKEGEGKGEEKKEVKSAEESYAVVAAKVQGLEAKVQSAEEELKKLIEEKQHTTDPAKLNEIVKQMLTLHKQLKDNAKEYDQQRALLRYRYPEKGLTEKREYERVEVKSLEEMESQMSLSSSVKRTMKKVRMQYQTPEEAKAHEDKESQKKVKSAQPQKPELTEPVIMKK